MCVTVTRCGIDVEAARSSLLWVRSCWHHAILTYPSIHYGKRRLVPCHAQWSGARDDEHRLHSPSALALQYSKWQLSNADAAPPLLGPRRAYKHPRLGTTPPAQVTRVCQRATSASHQMVHQYYCSATAGPATCTALPTHQEMLAVQSKTTTTLPSVTNPAVRLWLNSAVQGSQNKFHTHVAEFKASTYLLTHVQCSNIAQKAGYWHVRR
jgi:hypothetical protein